MSFCTYICGWSGWVGRLGWVSWVGGWVGGLTVPDAFL